MKKIILIIIALYNFNAFSQIETVSLDSTCNSESNTMKKLQCWNRKFSISNDIDMLISDDAIESVSTMIKKANNEIIDLKLKNSRPAIYNSHIYYILSHGKISYIICDSLLLKSDTLHAITIVRNKLVVELYNIREGRIYNLKTKVLWENTDCSTIDFVKTIASVKYCLTNFCIDLFVKDDCNNRKKIIKAKW